MRALRWGILGTGKIARLLASTMQEVPQWAEPVAVASRTAERAAAFAAAFPGMTPVVGCAELAVRDDVDAVYVASVPSAHLEHALVALEAGKPVLCEKPLAVSAAQAHQLADAARSSGVFLMEALWTRFVPSIRHLDRLVRSGRIGAPRLVDAELGMVLDVPADHYLWDRDRGGGVLLDVGPYAVSLATMLLGVPGAVTGLTADGPTGVDVAAVGALRFESGAIANLRLSFQTDIAPTARIYGTEGWIGLESPLFDPPSLVITGRAGETERLSPPRDAPGWAYQLREVAQCVATGRTESDIMPLAESILCATTLDTLRGDTG